MPDCLVVGGGIIGMLTARELRQAGVDVALLERHRIGRESSWAGGGIVSPLYPWRYPEPVTRLAHWSQTNYRALAEALAESTGIDPEWTRNGLLILDPEDMETAIRWSRIQGVACRKVDQHETRRLEPALASTVSAGVWMEEVAQIRNPRLVKALHQDLKQQGVGIHENITVRRLRISAGRIEGIDTDTGILKANTVIVCAGAWSGELAAATGIQLPVEPVLGQMILFRSRPGLLRRITLASDRYAIPRRDGRILFGSTLEYNRFDKRTTPEARAELAAIARAMFPRLRTCEIEHHWAGLRPGSPSGIPFVTAVEDVGGLFLHAGHFRNGVVLGPASARLMADIVLERPPIVPPEPYGLTAERANIGKNSGIVCRHEPA